MAALIHEIWETTENGMVLHICCMAGSLGAACRETLASNSRLLITYVAGCHFDAMTIYNRFLSREPYSSEHDGDYQAYPEKWVDEQRSVDTTTILRLGEFTHQWFELCIVIIVATKTTSDVAMELCVMNNGPPGCARSTCSLPS